MSQRLYLDYNATSPLSKSVIKFLSSGDLPFANPASIHTSGKNSKRLINQVSEILKKNYSLSSEKILYHSGATEALNTFFNLSSSDVMIYSKTDHPALGYIASNHRNRGGDVFCLDSLKNGSFDYESLECILKSINHDRVYLNITWVNNESGLINKLDMIETLKKSYSFFVHVDAVQSVGRFEGWNHIDFSFDMISFSAHKFGALKGVGFSILDSSFSLFSLIRGGGQQRGLRSGTENLIGVYSIKLALEDIKNDSNIVESYLLKEKIEGLFLDYMKDKGILLQTSQSVACNTVGLIFKKIKSDLCLIQFDLEGVDVSYGSACSSGNISETQTLSSMGFADFQDHFIRLSFGPFDYKNKEIILNKLEKVFLKISIL